MNDGIENFAIVALRTFSVTQLIISVRSLRIKKSSSLIHLDRSDLILGIGNLVITDRGQ